MSKEEKTKFDRTSIEYQLAERIIHLERALKIANKELKKFGSLGVLPNYSISFKESSTFHKDVRKVLKTEEGWKSLEGKGLDNKLEEW